MAVSQAVDAHSSFVYLVDNIPKWQTSIESLASHTAKKTEDFAAEYTRLVNQAIPRRKKSDSLSSIHSNCEQEPANDQHTPTDNAEDISYPDPQEINPLEAGNRYLYAHARKKRKPGPSFRSGASGPQKFRHRSHVVVYYDGYLQEELDAVVKQVGTGRNNLRKGKHALAAATGFRLPTLPMAPRDEYPTLGDIRSTMIIKSTSVLLSTKKTTSGAMHLTPNERSFVHADKELEQIQSLCETAAHQFLRDGDCKTELDGIRDKLTALLAQATSTMESLKTLQESHDVDNNAPVSEIDVLPTSKPLSTQSSFGLFSTLSTDLVSKTSRPSIGPPLHNLKSMGILSAPVIPTVDHVNESTTDTIEVDDTSDQESIDVDLTPYRLPNSRRVRT